MRRFAIVGLIWSAAACTHPANGNMCITGDQKECPCLGGGQGVQLCLADGTYDVCQCPEMGVPGDDLAMSMGDLGADLAWDTDLAGVDLAGADLAGADLSTPLDLTAPIDLSQPPDLAKPPVDLAGVDLNGYDFSPPVDFGGTTCGSQLCSGSQVCCLTSQTMGACFPPTGCDGGASPFACDGPEDCNGGQCCVVVDTNGSGGETGMSYCASSCPSGSYSTNSGGGAHEVSMMCHSDFDCLKYNGTVPLAGTVPYDGCCHSAATGDYHVCIPPQYASLEGYTCP